MMDAVDLVYSAADALTVGLNEPQRQAVLHMEGPLLVFAGAGSGKTRVITHRAAHLLRQGVRRGRRATPEDLLLVTFTNKAAGEMKERLATLAPASRRICAGTFHSIGARILRAHAGLIDRTKDFVIYDESDQAALVRKIVLDIGLDKKCWPHKLILERIEVAKRHGYAPDELPAVDPESAAFRRIWTLYEERLMSCNALDFEDLILKAMRLSERQDAVGEAIRGRFGWVMVDEFQDTNTTQYRLVRALGANRNLCVVGDDDQCIYSWRGANVTYIRHFQRDFPDATVVLLVQNYRSTARIVRAATGVISPSFQRVPKALWTQNPAGAPVRVAAVGSDLDEGKFVADEIERVVATGQPLTSVAILYRTHAQSRVLEHGLRDARIPYAIIGGVRFYERKEVKDALAFLRLLVTPASDVDLLRVINVPPRGIGETTKKRIGELAASLGKSMWAALPDAEATHDIRRAERLQIRSFREAIELYAARVDREPPRALAARVLAGTGYRRMYEQAQEEARQACDAAAVEDATERLRNIDEMLSAIAAYEAQTREDGDTPTLPGYLHVVSLLTDESTVGGGDEVRMMTVHAAKGMEFGTVYLVGFEDGLFPIGDGMNPLDLEEERRLAYVAFTRAREALVISCAGQRFSRGVLEHRCPSRFLFDVPSDVLERVEPELRRGKGRKGRS